AGGLFGGWTRTRERAKETEREIGRQLPVHVEVGFSPDVSRCDARAKGLGLIVFELVEDHAAADCIAEIEMPAHLVRDQVRVREKVLARDFALPPRAPVVEAEEQRIERFVRRRPGIVALKKRVAV